MPTEILVNTKNANDRIQSRPSKDTLTKEVSGDQAGPQASEYSNFSLNGYLLRANGGTFNNPMGFPGYLGWYTADYPTWRWMLKHPIIRLVREIAVSAIFSSNWEYEVIDKKRRGRVPKALVPTIAANLDPLREQMLSDYFTWGRDFGWAGGEPLWEVGGGESRLVAVKPLLHDTTEVLRDKLGNFVGLRSYTPPDGSAQPYVDMYGPYKAWKFTYDMYAGYHYGRSWLENVRDTAWKDWLDAASQMQKLGAKISGIVSVIISPPGAFVGANGKEISYKKNAETAIEGLANGAAGVWLPSIGITVDDKGNVDLLRLMAELSGKSLTNFQLLDFGNQSAAIDGLLKRMVHDEQLMFAGGLRPARSGLQGESGARAEAEQHAEIGNVIAERDDSGFAHQLQPIVDAIAVLNFGPEMRGRVRVNPPPLAYKLASVFRAMLLSLLNDGTIAAEIVRTVDMDKLFKVLGISVKKDFDAEAITSPADTTNANSTTGAGNPSLPEDKPSDTSGSPEPEGGRPQKETT